MERLLSRNKSSQIPSQLLVRNVNVGPVNPSRQQHVIDVLDVLRQFLRSCCGKSVAVEIALFIRLQAAGLGIDAYVVTNNHVCIAQVVALNGMDAANFTSDCGVVNALADPVVVRTVPPQVNRIQVDIAWTLGVVLASGFPLPPPRSPYDGHDKSGQCPEPGFARWDYRPHLQ